MKYKLTYVFLDKRLITNTNIWLNEMQNEKN